MKTQNTNASNGHLLLVPTNRIDRNPENPRLFFRPNELETLQESIRRHGIQVPINVYRQGSRYVLIDGERRWRCASKLNLPKIPALVQPEPSRLNNVLLMFNIHALREQWDLLTIAVKLPRVIQLLGEEIGRKPTESEISQRTGLNRSVIRRCKLLIELPPRYMEEMLGELERPKSKQKLTEDFFIEMERALKTVSRAMPEVIPNKNTARDVLIQKYRTGVIKDIIDLRYLPKISRAEALDEDPEDAKKALRKVLSLNAYSPAQAYEDTVADVYVERDLGSRLNSLLVRLGEINPSEMDPDLRAKLRELHKLISHLLRTAI